MAIQRVGVLYNPLSEGSISASTEVSDWLQSKGIEVWRGVSSKGRGEPVLKGDVDLLVALGGDGTVLRATRLAIPHRVPILAVALGHLSFMADLEPEDLKSGLQLLIDGGGWHDERALVDAKLERDGKVLHHYTALNEVLMTRGNVADVQIDGTLMTTYHADGVMVATATGSTAYALAAGGPIVDPRSRALVLASVAAHLTNVPSMVLHEDTELTLILRSRHPATLAVDGRDNVSIHENDVVRVRRSEHTCIFARVHPPSQFYAGLSRRLRRE